MIYVRRPQVTKERETIRGRETEPPRSSENLERSVSRVAVHEPSVSEKSARAFYTYYVLYYRLERHNLPARALYSGVVITHAHTHTPGGKSTNSCLKFPLRDRRKSIVVIIVPSSSSPPRYHVLVFEDGRKCRRWYVRARIRYT